MKFGKSKSEILKAENKSLFYLNKKAPNKSFDRSFGDDKNRLKLGWNSASVSPLKSVMLGAVP